MESESKSEVPAADPTPVKMLVSERFGLVFVWVPKCASRTLHRFFLSIHGVETSQPSATSYYRHHAQSLQAEHGLSARTLTAAQAIELKAERPDYKWFTIVRDPYRRSLSNYSNKINRYARQYRRGVYFWGKIRQILSGPKAWKDAQSAMAFMKKRISFEEKLIGLREHGIQFEDHYRLQTDHIHFGEIEYDAVMRMEELSDQLPEFFKSVGVDTSELILRKDNATTYANKHEDYYSPLAKAIVEELYADDFEKLGYPLR